MNRKLQIGIVVGFFVYLAFFLIFFVVKKDVAFSELENRNLELAPKMEKETVLDGSFGRAFEMYVADQFPLRAQMIAIKSNVDRFSGKKDNRGVFIGKDGYFLQDFQIPDLKQIEKNVGYMEDFAAGINTYYMIAPTATKVLEDKLPKYAVTYDEGEYLQKIQDLSVNGNYIDLLAQMQNHKDEEIYYRTDHHWTTLGAYYAYVAFCESYGMEPMPLLHYKIEKASEAFYGTLFSKGNFTFAKPDTLEIFHQDGEEDVTVFDVNANETKDSMYERNFLEKKDKYGVFLNQNQPMLMIHTGVDNGKKLAVVKDSYANCLIPFLTAHFEEIHVLDPRFLNMPLLDYVKQGGIQDAIILYNVQNFAEETKLSVLKY